MNQNNSNEESASQDIPASEAPVYVAPERIVCDESMFETTGSSNENNTPVPARQDVSETAAEGGSNAETPEPEYPTSDVVIQAKNVFITHEPMSRRELNGKIKAFESIPVPEVSLDQEADIRENNPAVGDGDGREHERWRSMVTSADDFRPMDSRYEKTVNREGSEFHQHINTQHGPLGFTVPSFNDTDRKLSGDAALLRVRAIMGQGSLVSIPLVHSGFWITIRTPSDGQIIELRRLLMEERIRLGRSVHGLILSNATAYSSKYLLDMAMDHLFSTTINEKDPAVIRSLIKTPDLNIIFAGLASAVYPTGFEYVKAVMNKEGIKNGAYETGLIDVKKLLWVDNASLEDRHRRHMANRQRDAVTRDMVEIYQKSMRMAEGRTFDIKTPDESKKGQIRISLKIPSAVEYINAGEQWIQGLADIIERTLTGDRDDERRRNTAIFEHARVTQLRQYAHWVEAFYLGDTKYDSPEVVAKMLDSMSENEEAALQILEEVGKFIDDCTVAVIAIPSSNGEIVGPDRFPRLIPIDPVTTFFTLFIQRANRLTQ